MDPFALQQAARIRTFRLIPLAAFAVLATAAATGLVALLACWGIWLCFGDTDFLMYSANYGVSEFCRRYPQVAVLCFVFSLFYVVVATLGKLFRLSSGDALMEVIGATRLRRGRLSQLPDDGLAEERFLNVCEEISIASGMDMPSVWVLEDEGGVNAFAAGCNPSSAAVCVTRGALEWLTRDELQGVVAHEFSHILNGDMRLNFRLASLICGITAVSRLGKWMLSVFGSDDEASFGCWRHADGRGDSKFGGPLPLMVIYVLTGIALWLVGSIGEFFAKFVKCAVSREREFLADAASAQFTRNPEALANALRFTYLAHASGCRTFNVWRDDISHMLFVSGKDTVFETHPPVKERIRRLSPFGGEAANETVRSRVRAIAEQRRARAKAVSENIAKGVARSRALKSTDASIADARIQPAAIAAVRDPAKAGETLIDLLRGRTPECWQGALSPSERRTLALRCVNTIRDRATVSQRRFWADEAERAVLADGEYDSFELMVTAAVRRRLLSDNRMPKVVPARKLLPVVARVIATVASLGDDPDGGYRTAERKLSLFGSGLPPMPEPYDNAPDILAALEALVSLPPLAKREVLMGLRETVAQDGKVAEEEVDYLAAVADAIGAYGWMQIQTRAVEPKWSNLV